MNFINEKIIDLWFVNESGRYPATMYLRFNILGVGVYMRLKCERIDIEVGQVEQPKNFLAALQEGLLPMLPDDAYIELTHTVDVISHKRMFKSVLLTERIGKQKANNEVYAKFQIEATIGGTFYEASSEEDIYYAFLELARQINGSCCICSYCKYAQIINYGGDDMRHGLYCFRDNLTDLATITGEEYTGIKDRGDPQEWAERSWSNVDAFHTCPSFCLAEVSAE